MLRNRFRSLPLALVFASLSLGLAVGCVPAAPGGSGDDGRGTGGDGAAASGTGGDTAQGGNGGSSGTGGSSQSSGGVAGTGGVAGSGGRGGGSGSGTNTGGSTAQGGGTGGASPAGTGGASAGTGGAAANPDAASMDPPDLGGTPLMECAGGSIDRFQKWLAHTLIVGSGGDASTLVKEGDRYVSKARFQGGDWAELVVQLANSASGMVDLTGSAGFSISYSATAPMWIELRGMVKPHGSEQYVVQLPATGGMTTTKFVPLTPDAWTFLPDLGKPTHSFADTLKTAYIFDIIGKTANTVTFSGLRFDKYVPTCR